MKIDIPLQCPSCGGKMCSISYDSAASILKKKKLERNAVMGEIQKNSKNPFAVHNSIFYFSKQSIIVELIIMKIDNTLKVHTIYQNSW